MTENGVLDEMRAGWKLQYSQNLTTWRLRNGKNIRLVPTRVAVRLVEQKRVERRDQIGSWQNWEEVK
jgi:hypothetical protein